MRLVRLKVTAWEKDGKRVSRGTSGAVKKVTRSAKWYVQLRINGKPKRFALAKEKSLAKRMARELLLNRQAIALGLKDAFAEHRRKPLAQHIADFLADLEGKGRSVKHVATMKRMLEAMSKGVSVLAELEGSKVDAFLQAMAKEGKSPRTRNSFRQAILALCNWLVTKRRLPANPLTTVSKAEHRQVRKRRALGVDTLKKLLEAADKRHAARGLLYRLAIYTGLRRNELKALKVSMLHLEQRPFHIHLPGEFTKNKKDAILPLPDALVEVLKEHCRNKLPTACVVKVPSRLNVRFRKDLKAAGIPYVDDNGAYADFHSLRKCTATLLALAGVHPKVAQQFLRHSTIELTMGVYTDANLLPLAEAAKALPDL